MNAASLSEVVTLPGKCDQASGIEEGEIKEDLSKRHSSYFCDFATITFYNANRHHLLVGFAEKQSHMATTFGFGGITTDASPEKMKVERVYLPGSHGEAVFVTEGECQFISRAKKITGIVCGVKIDQEERRTIVVVSFAVASR